jgi:hypothetical protein
MTPTQVFLLLACSLLTTGCASMTPPPGRGMNPSATPSVADASVFDESPRVLASPPGPERPQRLPRHATPSWVP